MPKIVDKLPEAKKQSTADRPTGRTLMFQRVDTETGEVLSVSSYFHDCFKRGSNTRVEHYWK